MKQEEHEAESLQWSFRCTYTIGLVGVKTNKNLQERKNCSEHFGSLQTLDSAWSSFKYQTFSQDCRNSIKIHFRYLVYAPAIKRTLKMKKEKKRKKTAVFI